MFKVPVLIGQEYNNFATLALLESTLAPCQE